MVKWSAIIMVLSVAIASLAAPLTARAGQISFQGLTGASTRQDVLRRFPDATPSRSLCQPSDTVMRSADGVASCDELVLSSYRVGDTQFEASFLFSLSGKLWQVILLYDWPVDPDEAPNWQQIYSKYMDFRNLLTTRYGEPLMPAPCPELGDISSQSFTFCSMWQGSRARYYEPSQGAIDLDADGFKHDVAETHYHFAHVGITYHLIPTDDAGRL